MTIATLAVTLIACGLLLAAGGMVLLFASKVPGIGHLPGDFSFHAGSLHVYAPLATCLLLSLILTVILNLFVFRK